MNTGKKPAKKTGHAPKIPFFIEKMDPLGQGVFRDNGSIGFIAKTLPGETGSARLLKTSKGVKFARCETLDQRSPQRIEPSCPHFGECPGCHYLHTPYEQELAFKQEALQQLLHRLNIDNSLVTVIPATQRLAYRNRIQLHYRGNRIGLVDGLTDTLVEIPGCKILREELQPALQQLYNDKSWAKGPGKEGHCELYLKDGSVSLQWNQGYAHGGFTQVFEQMNQRLCDEITRALQHNNSRTLLDLFAGNGNLSNAYMDNNEARRVMVDATPNTHPDFIELDLFSDDALKKFHKRCPQTAFDTLLLDPPRKGFPELAAWVKQYRPKKMLYVSCNPATLARDLQSLPGKFEIEKVLLLDLFPSTYHFETMVTVNFKKHGNPP